jgi:hypothetical protein
MQYRDITDIRLGSFETRPTKFDPNTFFGEMSKFGLGFIKSMKSHRRKSELELSVHQNVTESVTADTVRLDYMIKRLIKNAIRRTHDSG